MVHGVILKALTQNYSTNVIQIFLDGLLGVITKILIILYWLGHIPKEWEDI